MADDKLTPTQAKRNVVIACVVVACWCGLLGFSIYRQNGFLAAIAFVGAQGTLFFIGFNIGRLLEPR